MKYLYIILFDVILFLSSCEKIIPDLPRDNPLDGKNDASLVDGVSMAYSNNSVVYDNNNDDIINKGEIVYLKVFLVNNTRLPLAEIDKLLAEENPRDAKMKTAKIITAIFHGEELAQKAEDYFISKIQKKEAPDDVEEISLGLESETLLNILKKALPDMSGGELKRLISQNAVRLDGEVRTDEKETINLNKEGMILNVGKRTWLKIKA